MSKSLLYNDKSEEGEEGEGEENNHFKISEVLPEEEQQVKEKEFIILCLVA
jgi:hypothetical protein